MLTIELEMALRAAIKEAKIRQHEYVTVEHVLFSILHDNYGRQILEACGGDIENLKARLLEFFDKNLEKLPKEVQMEPQQSIGLQ